MKTKAILFLTTFMVMLLISGSSADNQSNHSYTPPLSPVQSTMTTSNDAPDNKPSPTSDQIPSVTMTEEKSDNDTIPATSSPSNSSIGTSSFQATEQPDQSSLAPNNSTTPPSPQPTSHKFMLFFILLAIVVLMLFVGCLHAMKEAGQDSCASRFLLGVRQRLRVVIGNVEDWIGLHLWPGGKRENEDDEEEAERRQGDEEGQRVDDGGKGGSCGARNEKKGEHKEDDSDDSPGSSSMEGDNLRETALSRQEEEERKQSWNEDEEETSSESEGEQSDVGGESKGDKKGGSEVIALVNSVQEDEEKTDFSVVTVL